MKRPIFFFAILLAAGCLFGQNAEKQPQVDRIFSEFNNQTPGCAVALEKSGAVALKAGYGMADLERNVPISPDTVFESGSLAKQFTAAALMLMAQQGKLSLDDPVRKYLPELPDYETPLTIRHVLSHVSGLREWRSIAEYRGMPEGRLVYTNRDLLEMASMQRALNFEPGTHYSYTNTGFNISTILIERALGTGETFPQFTQKNIFIPLGMMHSRWREDYRTIVPNRALAYARSGAGFIQDTPVEDIIGAGGLLTTVGDLLLWNGNFTDPRVGGPEMVKAQQTTAVLKNGRRIEYAAGLEVTEWDGLREVAHSGSTGGYRTWLARYPDRGVSIAVMCNSAGANPTRLGRETARLWTEAQPVQKPTVPFEADAAALTGLAGLYRNTLNSTAMEVKWANGRLTASGGAWTPTAVGQFSAGGQKVYVETGSPTRLRVVSANDETLFERAEPAHPNDDELRGFLGKYFSPDTGSTVTISAGSTPGSLAMRIGSGNSVGLRPSYKDAFATATGAIRFLRDASGSVTGFSAGDARTWDLPFERLR